MWLLAHSWNMLPGLGELTQPDHLKWIKWKQRCHRVPVKRSAGGGKIGQWHSGLVFQPCQRENWGILDLLLLEDDPYNPPGQGEFTKHNNLYSSSTHDCQSWQMASWLRSQRQRKSDRTGIYWSIIESQLRQGANSDPGERRQSKCAHKKSSNML